MKNLMRFLICALPLALITPAMADLVNVTGNSEVTLNDGDSLLFYISDPSTSSGHNASYPSEIAIVLGSLPVGGSVEGIPGTSGGYVSGWLFSATLESADGSISIPLSDNNSTRLGLSDGTLLLSPGAVSGGPYSGPVDVVSAEVSLTPQQAAAVFGSGEAVIDIENVGNSITFGYPGSLITNDFSASLISDGGSESEGAQVMQSDCKRATTPEPGTVGLLLIGVAVIGARLARRRTAGASNR